VSQKGLLLFLKTELETIRSWTGHGDRIAAQEPEEGQPKHPEIEVLDVPWIDCHFTKRDCAVSKSTF
jgi:hypothetical protein